MSTGRNTEAAPLEGRYDYVIVGAGTAGCLLANRLSADPATRVLLLEAGGSDRYHWIDIPVGYLYCMGNPRTDWMMKTAPEPGLNGRALAYPRGKVLGGCSAINGMIYMRGQAADYDGWRQMGNSGWAWDDVLPFFLKTEDNFRGASEMHGAGGEWKVARQRLSWPILEAVRDAAEEIGIPRTEDFNLGTNEGSGLFEVNQKGGMRWHAAKAFLRPIRKRPNLRVLTGAHACRIVLEDGRASGVEFEHQGRTRTARADGEVLLTAGAIGSPHLLELSGIGGGDRLADLAIPVHRELPGVGENLQDHLQLRMIFRISNTPTLNEHAGSLFGKAKMALEYAVRRSGPLSMAPSQLGIFAKSDPSLATPDLEYHVQPLSCDRLGEPLHPYPAITVSVCNLRPASVGHVHVAAVDPHVPPEIRPNYLSEENDRRIAVAAIRHARRLMAAHRLAEFSPVETLPGPGVQDDATLLQSAGDIGTTIFHPVGTCRMGADAMAVVDDRLRLHGVAGLRVIDASVMPRIVSGNTASPVVMIAEKAAAMIREDAAG